MNITINNHRKWFQVHLITVILISILAALLLWLNLRSPQIVPGTVRVSKSSSSSSVSATYISSGWPFSQEGAYIVSMEDNSVDPNTIDEEFLQHRLEENENLYYQINGLVSAIRYRFGGWFYLLSDMLVCFALMIFATWMIEMWFFGAKSRSKTIGLSPPETPT